METIAKIRNRYYVGKQAISKIARDLRLARNTVKRILKAGVPTGRYLRQAQILPQLGAHVTQLEALLQADATQPTKRRHTAKGLYVLLKAQGYQGAYDSVQRYVKVWRKRQGLNHQAYVPLSFAPGEAYQFDWSQELVVLAGVKQIVHVAHVRLCFSRVFLVIAYPRESQEMLFDAHNRAFAFFGGNPIRGIYDNLKTGIDQVLGGKERRFNPRFLTLLAHYLIDPTACTPGAGWEKGQVENQVQMLRKQLFVSAPAFNNLSELNAWLQTRCTEIAASAYHPEQKDLTLQTVFTTQEQAALQAYIAPFDGFIERISAVSATCLVRFDHNSYSVDYRCARASVSLRCYAQQIILVADGEIVGQHERCFERQRVFYDPWHYVPILARKPGALRNGAPFQQWQLPSPIKKVYNHLLQRNGGDREFVKILAAMQSEGLEAITVACELALEAKAISADYVLNVLWRLRPAPPVDIVTPAQLALTYEPQANCQRYDQLLEVRYATA